MSPYLTLAEKHAAQARTDPLTRKRLRYLLGPDWPEFAARHDLGGAEVPPPAPQTPPPVIRSGRNACVHLGVLDPPQQPGCGCLTRTFRCEYHGGLCTVMTVAGHRSCAGCPDYERRPGV